MKYFVRSFLFAPSLTFMEVRNMGKELDKKDADAFLGAGWEDVRYKVPKGKFRVALIDMFDYTTTIIGDFDDESSAKKYVLDNEDLLGGYESLVIYNDEGKLVYNSDWRK